MDRKHEVLVEIERDGQLITALGFFTGSFIIENGRLLVPLTGLHPPSNSQSNDTPVADVGDEDLWVDVRQIKSSKPIVLRSELWEVPGGQTRDVMLRSLAHTLGEQFSRHAHRIDLAKELPGYVELIFFTHIPLSEGAAYQAKYAPIRLRLNPRTLPWKLPENKLVSAKPKGNVRYDSHIGHLPLWLDGTHLWSAYIWDGERLVHALQFSLKERFRRTLVYRFKMK